MASTRLKTSLTEPPSNLKEAIDWILRVSGKDGQHYGSTFAGLIDAVKERLKEKNVPELQNYTAETEKLKSYLQGITGWYGESGRTSNMSAGDLLFGLAWELADTLAERLADLMGYKERSNGIANMMEKKYKSSYSSDATWEHKWRPDTEEAKKCAENFMTSVMLIYPLLTELYWQCRPDSGPWKAQQMDGKSTGTDLKDFLTTKAGFDLDELNTDGKPDPAKNSRITPRPTKGSTIASKLRTVFPEFKSVDSTSTFDDFLKKLTENAKGDKDIQKYPLTILYLVASSYLNATAPSVLHNILKTIAGVTAVGAGATAAWYTQLFGLAPFLTTLVT
ncbi:variant erythrocyte surface antigen-1 family protein [Babesia caballi]|uniref:Variant erythrocyte surface antigen-1 family protein n=1 Tax=Babesia caballi TaxID=5871 RepID=A0AAV4LQ76_BABCB|nr:variant erythrocyte surface antigen-1 family protein [Babesia caballi]